MASYTADDVPEGLVNKHRYMYVEDSSWYDDLIPMWVERMQERGIGVHLDLTRFTTYKGKQETRDEPKVYFNVGYPQDYCYFEADTSSQAEWDKLIKHLGVDGQFPVFEEYRAAYNEGSFHASTNHYGGSSMGWTLELNRELFDYEYQLDDPLGDSNSAARLLQDVLDAELDELEELIKGAYEAAADDLLEDLQAEMDHLTSDEFIAERIAECCPEWIEEYRAERYEDAA